ncbi:hypothetical protein SAMN05444007_108246 [Cribrihabitans marinus]|uniref:Uncharacterized protein n=1 Tax=Cribrihabitans marinus TaxID=1227549 RepID=A0A1H7CPY3_9RHOB|nr:hypothetical protein [Cribrihabitans marinus]GGH36287.1 hypothetical protein GCM10010973_30160 [Cribrihabitans marinus]SEJ91536.1 hypothetical protein SAMN05444007_108246 [Cribrihabitans marinus]
MIDQFTFDKAEEIAEALHEQGALADVLVSILGNRLPQEDERLVHGLLHAQLHCRNRAVAAATCIAKSGASHDL